MEDDHNPNANANHGLIARYNPYEGYPAGHAKVATSCVYVPEDGRTQEQLPVYGDL